MRAINVLDTFDPLGNQQYGLQNYSSILKKEIKQFLFWLTLQNVFRESDSIDWGKSAIVLYILWSDIKNYVIIVVLG